MYVYITIQKTLQVLSVLTAFVLIGSLFLHTVQLRHVHPGELSHSESHNQKTDPHTLNAYTHGTEQKLFIILLLSFIALGTPVRFFTTEWMSFFKRMKIYVKVHYDSRREVVSTFLELHLRLLGDGILHSKVHEPLLFLFYKKFYSR